MRWVAGLLIVAAATAGCASAHPGGGAGAVGAPAPTLPPASIGGDAPVPTTTVVPAVGGTPAEAHLVSGAAPADSPPWTVRGTTWPSRNRPVRPVPLAAGGYEADLYVSAEKDAKTGQPYRCSVEATLVTTDGSTLFRAPPQSSGMTARTFVVAGRSSADVEASGSVGCNWTIVVYPA